VDVTGPGAPVVVTGLGDATGAVDPHAAHMIATPVISNASGNPDLTAAPDCNVDTAGEAEYIKDAARP
jgi:hypothetical protein